VLIVLWALGFFLFPVVGGLVHILLLFAIVAVIWHFLKGRNATPRVWFGTTVSGQARGSRRQGPARACHSWFHWWAQFCDS